MSHILNALERAAADRERHVLPGGLRLAPVPPPQADDDDDRPTGPPRLLIGGAVLVSAALAAWLVSGHRPAQPPATAVPPVVQVAPTVAVSSGTASARRAERPAPPAEAAAPQAGAASAGAVPPGATPTPPAPAAPLPLTQAVTRDREPQHPAPQTHTPAADRGVPAPPRRRIHALDELPPEIRRELPPLAISLWMHSDVPAHRMLVINGESYKEGSRIRPDLWLEQIGHRGAVFRYRGWRYRVGA